MTITEAKRRCEKLTEQIADIQSEYNFEGYARYVGKGKIKSLKNELNKLLTAIAKAENETEIKA